MATQWTQEQKQAIEERGKSILVAAAAGSGKTAVLVERIIRLVCDQENPVSIDRLLVLTFTEAAAAEMKRKIAAAMEERLRLAPDDAWLREQSLLVPSAHISTVHAFCKIILQNNIHKTDIPADFTLVDETENAVLRNQALDRVLERYYRHIEKKTAFRELVMGYGGTKNDENLRSMVLRLHDFTRSLAYPKKWLYDAAMQYKTVCKQKSLQGTVFETLLLELCRELAGEVFDGLMRIRRLVDAEVPSDHKYFPYYAGLPDLFLQSYAPVLADTPVTLEEISKCHTSFVLPRAPQKNGLDEVLVERINRLKKQLVQEPLEEIRQLLQGAEPERLERIMRCSPRIQVLKQLVRQTERLHKQMKRERSVLDFGDLEHEMMRLLSDRKGNPTETAMALQRRFAEILVDEYQDTNDIQDTMFRLLSRGEKNLFMVGDLKQSIYRFRNADPTIFAEKYRRYSMGDGGVCIRLFKNFRSRAQVVDSVNGIFSGIMHEKTGGLAYTEEEYLVCGADYAPDTGDFTTELLLTDVAERESEGEREDLSAGRLEAISVAKRIRALVDLQEIQVTDKETRMLRPVRLGDITILVRNKNRVAELAQVLAEYRIPTISEVGEKYLDSLEVLTVLSFLQIIDNPRQDIPLLAVLRSDLFGFSPEELAEMRLSAKEGDFYAALVAAAEGGNRRAEAFLKTLEALRQDATHEGVDQLIFKICYDLHYMDLVGAKANGAVRQGNLHLLYERAAEFAQGTLQGLFHFMGYIESLRSGNKDMKAAKAFSDAENTVSIMTIHKSKGLEYPVVILCNMDVEFNERDAAAPVLWHSAVGLSMDDVDTRLRVRYASLARQLLRERALRDSRAEEMRLFYVALTRAKEKLILSTVVGNRYDPWKKATPLPGEKPAVGMLRRQRSMRDWTLSCLLAHPGAEALREMADCADLPPDATMQFPLRVVWGDAIETVDAQPLVEAKVLEADTKTEDLTERLEYSYPHSGLLKIPVKLSVSELKRRRMPEEDYAPIILQRKQVVFSELTQIGAAERGTITHYVMQHLDFAKTDGVAAIEEQLSQMVQEGLLTERQVRAVSAREIAAFFASPLGKRLREARGVEREFDFYMEIPAGSIDAGLSAADVEEKVLLQGIADCFFYEEDGVVLLDYKTDRIRPEQAEERAEQYREQLAYYTQGLQAILGIPVKERYLYFLYCGQAVKV